MDLSNLGLINSMAAKSTNNKYRLFLADLEDCDIDNWPTTTGGTMATSPLKSGKSWVYLDAQIGSIKPTAAKGDNELENQLTLTPAIEGITATALQWCYDNKGKRVVAVWERCVDGQKFIGGSPCSGGLKLTVEDIGSLDNNNAGIKLQLQGDPCPEPFHFASFAVTVSE